MPLIMHCDACDKKQPASVTAAGRVFATGWWYVRGDGKGICACCDEHFAKAMATPERADGKLVYHHQPSDLSAEGHG